MAGAAVEEAEEAGAVAAGPVVVVVAPPADMAVALAPAQVPVARLLSVNRDPAHQAAA